jgi:hypothetical protein
MSQRVVPPEVVAKYETWKFWHKVWHTVHIMLGFLERIKREQLRSAVVSGLRNARMIGVRQL